MSTPNDTGRPGFTPADVTPPQALTAARPARRDVSGSVTATLTNGLVAFVAIIASIAGMANVGFNWWCVAGLVLGLYFVYRIVGIWVRS